MKLVTWTVFLLILLTAGCIEDTEKTQQTPIATETITETPIVTETPLVTETPIITETPPAITSTPEVTPTPEPQTYIVFVDSDYGFFRVRHLSDEARTDLDVNNLAINVGDTVIWRSDDENYRVDIVSNDGLWNLTTRPDSALMWYRKEFRYTFNEPGVYTISVGGYPKLKNQTIVVKG
jgi:hypothetical protein